MRYGFSGLLLAVGMAVCLLAGCSEQAGDSPRESTAAEDAATANNAASAAGDVQAVLLVNGDNPGQKLDITPFIVEGKTNIFDFYSEYCPPCRRIGPMLEQLAEARTDIVVRKVDINRTGVQGIDWRGPLAQQYGLHSIPHFKIYGPDGTLTAEGQQASPLVMQYLQEAGIQ